MVFEARKVIVPRIDMGGHVRVGFEDNVYIEKSILAKSNSELVERIIRLATDFGRKIATPHEEREILGMLTRKK